MKTPLGLDARLPVTDLILEALQLLWNKRRTVVQLFLPVVALLAFLDWLSTVFLNQQDYALQLLFMAFSVGISVLMATACHRFTLLPAAQQTSILRLWGRTEFRYMVRGVQILLIAAVVFFVVMLGLMLLMGGHNQHALLSSLIALLPAVYLWGRLSITLPEISLGQQSGLRRAWDMSRGNGSKLVLVVVIVPLLMTAPFLLLYLLDNTLLNYLAAFGVYLTTLISLVMLSLAYRFLLEFFVAGTPEPQVSAASGIEERPDV